MLVKPAKVPSFGALSGDVGSFASWGATSPSVMADRWEGGLFVARDELGAVRRSERGALTLDRPFELVAAAGLLRGESGGRAEREHGEEARYAYGQISSLATRRRGPCGQS